LTVQRYVNGTATPDSGDVFVGSGTSGSGLYLNTQNAYVLYNGTKVGTFTESGGKLSITFASTGVTSTVVDEVLQGIAYSYSGVSGPLTPGVVIGAQIDDANSDPIGLNGYTPDTKGPHDQGPGGDLKSNVLTATVDVDPLAFVDTFTYKQPDNTTPVPIAVDGGAGLADILKTSATPTSITIQLSNAEAEDVLAFTNTAAIQGSYSGGVMTLTAVAGQTPTVAQWQAALRAVTYADTNATPDTTTRDVVVTVTDGANVASGTGTIALDVYQAPKEQPTPVPPPTPAPPTGPNTVSNFPDEQTRAQITGPNSSVSDDYLARPIIPQLSLTGSVASQYVVVEQMAVISLPGNLFADSLPNAQLSYEAQLPDGSPLPHWLSFDSTSLTFSGTPPLGAVGRVELTISARDILNNTATGSFSILVGHPEQDLIGMISGKQPSGDVMTPGQLRHLDIGQTSLNDGHAAAAGGVAAADHEPVTPVAHEQVKAGAQVVEFKGFTRALHAAGPMAAMARARHFLDGLDGLARNRSAG
jgi:hypothetical protein